MPPVVMRLLIKQVAITWLFLASLVDFPKYDLDSAFLSVNHDHDHSVLRDEVTISAFESGILTREDHPFSGHHVMNWLSMRCEVATKVPTCLVTSESVLLLLILASWVNQFSYESSTT